jgi:hypothetical protein
MDKNKFWNPLCPTDISPRGRESKGEKGIEKGDPETSSG